MPLGEAGLRLNRGQQLLLLLNSNMPTFRCLVSSPDHMVLAPTTNTKHVLWRLGSCLWSHQVGGSQTTSR